MSTDTIEKLNKYITLLPDEKVDQLIRYIFFLLEDDDFSEKEIELILKAKHEAKSDTGVEWKTIRRNDL